MKKTLIKIIKYTFIDLSLTGIFLCIFALFHHVIPHVYQNDTSELVYTGPLLTITATVTPGITSTPESSQDSTLIPTVTDIPSPTLSPTPSPTNVIKIRT